MEKQTLKELIEIEFDRCETISHFKKEVFRLIDLYDDDNSSVCCPECKSQDLYAKNGYIWCNNKECEAIFENVNKK